MTPPLFAVHLSDGAVTVPWLVGGWLVAAALVSVGAWRLREDEIPRVGVLTAAFFVASLAHVKVGPTSVHLLLNGLTGVMLGRRAGLAVAVGLGMQYALLGHGGLSTLGVNTVLMGVPAVVGGVLFRRAGGRTYTRGVLLGAGTAAATVVGNFAVLVFGGKDDWLRLAEVVLVAHVPVVVAEGLIVGVVVRYLEAVKPELLGDGTRPPG